MDKHHTMEKACRHLIDFMGIKEQVEKLGLGEFDLKLFRSEKNLAERARVDHARVDHTSPSI